MTPAVGPLSSGRRAVRIAAAKPLFAWDCLEDNPSLATIRCFLEAVPDAALLEGLRRHRGKGRDDYPVHVLWGVLLLTILLRHTAIEACLRELQRHDALCRLVGIQDQRDIPKAWNMSRFLDVLGQEPHQTNLRAVFDAMVQRLGVAVPDLGRHSAGDSSGLNARRSRQQSDDQGQDATAANAEATDKIEYDAHGLPQPAGGRKEYKDDDGVVTKVVEWFGYKFHLLVDVRHEVTLAYRVTSTKTGDNEALPDLLAQAQANLPKGRIKTVAYDKAADDGEVHDVLHEAGVKPLIQIRALWKEEPERLLPGHDGDSNVVYDEAGTVYCYDKVSDPPVRRPMAYIGHEASRGTLKYRCPAMHEGFECPMAKICNEGKSYGKTVRVKEAIDLRRFPPIPRATKLFERLYKGRTAVERVNGRMKIYWGVDDGNITGATRFHAYVGAVLVVHVGMATLLAGTARREGPLGRMELSPIAEALRERVAADQQPAAAAT
jgi:Transposase DDE domain